MRNALAFALLLVLALPAAGQPPVFNEDYQLHVAYGRFPATLSLDQTGFKAGAINAEQRIHHPADANTISPATRLVPLPDGATLVRASCTCGAAFTLQDGAVRFELNNSANSDYTITVASTQPYLGAADSFSLPMNPPDMARGAVAIVYTPGNLALTTGWTEAADPMTTTDGSATIHVLRPATAPQSPLWISFHPATTTALAPVSPAPLSPWLYAAAAFVAGCILWALLVRQGIVQKKTRRQSVAVSAHQEAAANEPAPVLEGRKRALMAALKEVELAKMNQEMDAATYDVVKADFKRQAVTVMRALESGEAKK